MFEKLICRATYSIQDYLSLLSTLSPYIALSPDERNSLFEGLRRKLKSICGESIRTSYFAGKVSELHTSRLSTLPGNLVRQDERSSFRVAGIYAQFEEGRTQKAANLKADR